MIRTTFVLLLALIGITTAEFFKCIEHGRLLEYKRVAGTKDVSFFSNEDKVDNPEDVWRYSMESSVPFIWDGSHLVRFNLERFPGTVKTIAYHSIHHEGDTDRVFPQSHVSKGGKNKYSTNQLVIEDFEKYVSNAYTCGFAQPVEVNLRVLENKPIDDWFFAFHIATEMENGYQRSFWTEGTQFQRFNWGKTYDCPLHNGFVTEAQCDLSESTSSLVCDGEQTILLENGPVYFGSSNPATSAYQIDESSCSFNVQQTQTVAKKGEPKDTVLVFTWFGIASDDSVVVSVDGTVFETVTGNGFKVLSVPSENVVVTFNRNDESTFEKDQEIHGFRVVAFTEGQGKSDCLEVGQTCENNEIKACVLATTENKCDEGWDEQCVIVADICKSFLQAELQQVSEYYTYDKAEIQQKLGLDVDDEAPVACRNKINVPVATAADCDSGDDKRSAPTKINGLKEFTSFMKHIKA